MSTLQVKEDETNIKFVWKYKNQICSKKIKKQLLLKEIEEFRLKKKIPQSIPYYFTVHGREILIVYDWNACSFLRKIKSQQDNNVLACTISYFF